MKHLSERLIALMLGAITIFGATAQVVVVRGGSVAKSPQKDSEKNELYTMLKDATWKRDVEKGWVVPYNSNGEPLDTIYARGYKWNGSEIVVTADVCIEVAPGDTSIVFEAGAPGFESQMVHWKIEPFGKREYRRTMENVYLKKSKMLKEVTVTSSKIKFYNKGDTVVYNADAFQLAEGSMLDALISQLPGAKIDEEGRITINGEFVEILLLNGKDLFDKEHKVMIENIPAYTVKNVEVFKGHNKEEKRYGAVAAPNHLTMDVKLKKEYSIGWLVNAQAGYGTEDRYLGRLFASWFSPTTSLILMANTNNLNSVRLPGKSDSWTPDRMPAGRIQNHEGALRYLHEKAEGGLEMQGSVTLSGSSSDFETATSTTNFLSSGNNYERRFQNEKTTRFSVKTSHYGGINFHKDHLFSYNLRGDYSKMDNDGSGLNGTFTKDFLDISRQALDAIYGTASTDTLHAIVNRSATLSEGRLRSGNIGFAPSVMFKLPSAQDYVTIGTLVSYTGSKRRNWNDYNINFGSDPKAAERLRQYTDNSPNHKLMLQESLSYNRSMRNSRFRVMYVYEFSNYAKDSYMYALDRLENMGIFGTLPANYTSTLDPSNSFSSTTYSNVHTLNFRYELNKTFGDNYFSLGVFPTIGIEHNRLDYWRENRNYLVKRTSFVMPRTYGTVRIDYMFGKDEETGRRSNRLNYEIEVRNQTPELLHLVDVVNTADPLNIEEGNPNLKNAFIQSHTLRWGYSPAGKQFTNNLRVGLEAINNSLVRGYVYNTETGVRRYKTYNVDGNLNFNVSEDFYWQFGSKKQFMLNSGTYWNLNNSADMIGINLEAPTKSQVRNQMVNEILGFSYEIGKQTIRLNGSVTHRHTTSDRPDFNTINAQHYQYGIGGIFNLPAGFGISTDLNFYKRVGYGVGELDSTDAVWNMRLTYTPKRSKWTIMADGFDLLHKLSNVNYAVTATGRMVTYTNTLPRYFIVTVQYRLNIQPKK